MDVVIALSALVFSAPTIFLTLVLVVIHKDEITPVSGLILALMLGFYVYFVISFKIDEDLFKMMLPSLLQP